MKRKIASAASGALALALPLALLALSAPCQAQTFPELSKSLGAGWHDAPLPMSSLTPGALVYIHGDGDQVDLRWIGTLDQCQVPVAALGVTSATPAVFSTSGSFSLGAAASSGFTKLISGLFGLNLSHAQSVAVQHASDQSLDYMSFVMWYSKDSNKALFQKNCGALLDDPDIYVVQEAYVVTQGTFSDSTAGGLKLTIEAPSIAPVPLAAKAIAAVTAHPAAATGTDASGTGATGSGGTGSGSTGGGNGLSLTADKTGVSGSITANFGKPAATTAPKTTTKATPAATDQAQSATSSTSTPASAPAATPALASAEDASPPSDPGLSAHASGDKAVTVTTPVTFAFKRLHQLHGSLQMMGIGNNETPDPLAGKTIRSFTVDKQ